jgi:hypothetical protein
VHVAAPARANVSLGHIAHALALLAPVTFEAVPAVQFRHAPALLAPETPENAPAGHGTHATPAARLKLTEGVRS